jgi:hypothetical protein
VLRCCAAVRWARLGLRRRESDGSTRYACYARYASP